MATADSLLSMTQSFITPDSVQKFSGAVGLPAEKIQSGLKSLLPTFLMGLVSKGSTSEGAESLVRMAKNQNLDGNEALNGIFGNNLSSVTSTLGSSTGMGTTTVTKMLGMIAPMAMGALSKKINQEGLSANGLMGFLGQQKSSLSSFLPAGLSGLLGMGAASSAVGSMKGVLNQTPTNIHGPKKRSWTSIAVVALLILGALWYFSGRNSKLDTPIASTVSNMNTTVRDAASKIAPAQSINEIGAFFKAGNASELPKRFSFQNLTFATGSTTLVSGSETELNQIASLMKEYPTSTARIEGFTDNTGDAINNQALSAARAEVVKQQLVARKIESDRIETVGRGQESPISDNSTDEGRAQNRRIEFVTTGF